MDRRVCWFIVTMVCKSFSTSTGGSGATGTVSATGGSSIGAVSVSCLPRGNVTIRILTSTTNTDLLSEKSLSLMCNWYMVNDIVDTRLSSEKETISLTSAATHPSRIPMRKYHTLNQPWPFALCQIDHTAKKRPSIAIACTIAQVMLNQGAALMLYRVDRTAIVPAMNPSIRQNWHILTRIASVKSMRQICAHWTT